MDGQTAKISVDDFMAGHRSKVKAPAPRRKIEAKAPFSNQKIKAKTSPDYSDIIGRASEAHNIDPGLIRAMIDVESSVKPREVSSKGAAGLMQLMKPTAEELGVTDRFDPEQNIMGGAQYLRQQLDRFDGNETLALAAYNAGAGNVTKYGGVPPFEETQNYIKKIADRRKKSQKKISVDEFMAGVSAKKSAKISVDEFMAGRQTADIPAEETAGPPAPHQDQSSPSPSALDRGKEAVTDFFRPSFAPESAGGGIPARKIEINERLGQLDAELQESAKAVPASPDFTTDNIDNLRGQLEEITAYAVDGRLSSNLYERYAALRPQYEKAVEDYNASINALNLAEQARVDAHNVKATEVQELTGELQDLEQQEYGAAMTRPISTITGEPILPTEPGFPKRLRQSWQTGEAQTQLGNLRFSQLMGDDSDEIRQRIEDLKKAMPRSDKIKRGLPERAVRAAAEMLPIQVQGLQAGMERGLVMGTGFAGIAGAAGQLGPQAVTPEEIVTMPGAFLAGYGVGTISGAIENIGKIEAGLAYDELLDLKDEDGNRVDPIIAKGAAASVGVINGLIEVSQIRLLLKTIPGGEALLRGAINETLKKVVKSKALDIVALRVAKKYAGFIGFETGQEVLQESTNILAAEVAKKLTNKLHEETDLPPTTIKEVTDRLLDTAEQSALAFSVMGLPGTAISGKMEADRARALREAPSAVSETQKDLAKEVIRKEVAKQLLSLPPSQPSQPPAVPERQIPTVSPMEIVPGIPPSAGPAPDMLPPGQGFELVEPMPETKLRPGPERMEGVDYPEGAEYVAGKPAPEDLIVEYEPIVSPSTGRPWKFLAGAEAALQSDALNSKGISANTHKIVKAPGGGYQAIRLHEKGVAEKREIKEKVKGKTLIAFIRAMGGIKDASLPGEIRALSSKETGIVGLTSSGPDKGLGFDEMASAAVEHGWLSEDLEDQAGAFNELLRKDIFAQKAKKPRVLRLTEIMEEAERAERREEFDRAEDEELEYFAKHPEETVDADLDQWQREAVEKIRSRNEADAARKIEESVKREVEAKNPDLEGLKGDEGFPEYIEGWDEKDLLDEEALAELEAWRAGKEEPVKEEPEPEKRPGVPEEKIEKPIAVGPVAEVSAKKPWEMTSGEYTKQHIAEQRAAKFPEHMLTDEYRESVARDHYDSVLKAWAANEPIPEKVMAEYPELAEKPKKARKKRVATIVPRPDGGKGYSVKLGDKGWVSGGEGALGGGSIGHWATVKEAREEGTKHLNKNWEVKIEVPEPLKKPVPTPGLKLANWVKYELNQNHSIAWRDLYKAADMFYGGTQAEGAYISRDAFDAMELGLNLWITERIRSGMDITNAIKLLDKKQGALATQTKRTKEQVEFQQFSTPPTHSRAMAWVANIGPNDVVLEPSAGTGSLVASALVDQPAEVIANELSARRAKLLENLGIKVYSENAAHLNAVLPADVKPTVVLMNPPFSSDILLKGKKKKTGTGAEHIEQALMRLEEGGRLVALAGRGMALDRPAFHKWWNNIQTQYNVKAVIEISGKEYKKFGTTFDNVLIIIDKTGPTQQPEFGPTIVMGKVDKVEDAISLLEGIRNERIVAGERKAPEPVIEKGVERPEVKAEPERPVPGAVDVVGAKKEEEPVQPGQLPGPLGDVGIPGETGAEGRATDALEGGRPGRRPVPGERRPEKPEPGRPGVPPDRTSTPTPGEGGRLRVSGEEVTGRVSTDVEYKENKPTGKSGELTDSLFEDYVPSVKAKGSQKHPAPIAESAAMAAVEAPAITHKPKIPREIIESGKLSDVQLEFVARAGEVHEQIMPDGRRAGIALSDGTGVGKGAQQAGVILDNWNRGRKKAVWISEKMSLAKETERDLDWVGMDGGKITFIPKVGEKIQQDEGVLYTTYSTLASEPAEKQKRLDQIVEWLGRDFDGVITFDECVPAGTMIATPDRARAIESLKVGDIVLGLNHETGKIEQTLISHTFKRVTKEPLYRIGDTEMTGNHPAYTANRDYIQASQLAVGDNVYYIKLPKHIKGNADVTRDDLQAVSGELHDEEKKTDILQPELFEQMEGQPAGSKEEVGEDARFTGMAEGNERSGKKNFGKNKEDRALSKESSSVPSFGSQPVQESNQQSKSVSGQSGEGISASQRGQRTSAVNSATVARNKAGVGDGTRCRNQTKAGGISDELQSRYSGAEPEDSNRSGWGGTQGKWQSKGERQEKDFDASIYGLESVEILERPGVAGHRQSDERSNDGCAVYNIETGTANYFANGLLVHNCHNMANAIEIGGARGRKPPSKKALAGIRLQDALPNARIVYASATAATEVENLAYAERLGLWGEGTAFASKNDFIRAIKSGGVAAMEVVASNLKSMGRLVSRTLAYSVPGDADYTVTYETLTHTLTENDQKMYNELAKSWQIVLENIDAVLEETGGEKSPEAKRNALGQFWGAQQRFFNQVLTSLPVPSLIKDMEKQLADGNSCVLQLYNTNEALASRRRAQAEEAGLALEDIDVTPRDIIMQYLKKSFPTALWEEYYDAASESTLMRQVRDSEGNIVEDPNAIAKRDRLIKDLAGLSVPETVMERVINHFGSGNVAEVTGRKTRLVRQSDGTVVEEKMTPSSRARDIEAFMDKKKRILVFSNAGGTGKGYHSDLDRINQEKRIHYLVQAGWIASRALQGFGRTHRTNQRFAPHDVLVTTDVASHKRFFSSIARRLDQLGALTKGERRTTGQGMFSAEMNLENEYADMALSVLFDDLQANRIEGLSLVSVARQMGFGDISGVEGDLVGGLNLSMQRFLNRMLSMEISEQNKLFDAFYERLEAQVQYAVDQGIYESGIETLRADKVEKISEQDIDVPVGKAKYTELELTYPLHPTTYADLENMVAFGEKASLFLRNKRSGKLYFFRRGVDITEADGTIRKRVVRVSPVKTIYINQSDVTEEKYERVSKGKEAKKIWDAQVAVAPKVEVRKEHLISGTLLPVWDRLPDETPKIARVQTDEGEVILGRRIAPAHLAKTKRALSLGVEAGAEITSKQALDALLENDATLVLANSWTIKTRMVSGEDRIEITGPTGPAVNMLESFGAFTEIIGYKLRVFVPLGQAAEIIGRVVKSKPVIEIQGPKGGAVLREAEAPYTEEQQTKSPAFKKWFKDSKVVDEKGEPLVVYHGTDQDFSVFDASMAKGTIATKRKYEKHTNLSHAFAENKRVSEFFANKARTPSGVLYPDAKIMSVFLSMKNPLIVDMNEVPESMQFETVEAYDTGKTIHDIYLIKEQKIEEARKNGHDGVIFRNGYDFRPYEGDVYFVFNSTQVKSATDNIGTFSKTDPSILKEPAEKYRQSELDLAFGGEEKADEAIETVAKKVEEVSRRGMPDRVAGAVPDSKIAKELRQRRRVDLSGKKLTKGNESQEIAELFQVYRSPEMEIMHAIYTDADGNILAHNAITSGCLDRVRPETNIDRYFLKIRSTAKRLGAARVHFLHNHPSGDPTMSKEDVAFACYLRRRLGSLGGEFVVIDHGKFMWVSEYGQRLQDPSYASFGDYKVDPGAGEWIDKKGPQLTGPEKTAAFGESLAYDRTRTCFIHVDQGNNVVGWSTHDNKILEKNASELEKVIRQQAKGYNATRTVIIADSRALIEPIVEHGNDIGSWLLDVQNAKGVSWRQINPKAFEKKSQAKPEKEDGGRVAWGLFESEPSYGEQEVIAADGTTVDWKKTMTLLKQKVYGTYKKDGSFDKWRTRAEISKIKALQKAEVKYKERLGKAKKKFETKAKKIKTTKEILQRRRSSIRAIKEYFNLSDSDLRKVSRKDIRLMSDFEFKVFKDGLKVKAEELAERRQRVNELELLRKERAFIAESNIRRFHELPTVEKMTTQQLIDYAEILSKYEKGDQFLTPKRIKGLEVTPWSGSKTIREVLGKAAKKFDVPMSELVGIRVQEIDRFRYDTSLARQNPFYNFMVDTINLASIKNQFRYFKEREKLYRLADLALKSRKRGVIGRLVPRQKELMRYLEAEEDAKVEAVAELTVEEMALADAMEDFYRRAYNWLLVSQELKSSRFADSQYVFHSKRPLSELLVDLKDTGIRSAARDLLNRWRLDEAQFKILDSKTGEILRMKKFFRQTLYRTGELTPTQNVVKATDIYMQQFFKKMALDESVPAIETLVMALRPKEKTPTGVFLNDSLMTFVKEYLNNKKGRALNIGIQQGGKIDTVIRFINQIISLRYIALNIPLEVAAIVGETTAKLPALGNRKLILANMRRHTPRGRRILKKYKAFTGEGVLEEAMQPARNIGENINLLLYGLFKWSRRVTKQDILLGNMTRAEFEAETIDPKKLAEATKMAGRWLDIEGAKSIMGGTSTGASITKFKGWAIPIASSTAQDAASLARTLTRLGDPKKRLTRQQFQEIYRIAEMGAILGAVMSLGIDDDDKDTFVGKLKYYAIRELGTLFNALSPRTMLTFGITIAFLEKLSQNLYLLMTFEKYKTRDEFKGVAALEKQFTPAAISQLKGKEKPKNKTSPGLSSSFSGSKLSGSLK